MQMKNERRNKHLYKSNDNRKNDKRKNILTITYVVVTVDYYADS